MHKISRRRFLAQSAATASLASCASLEQTGAGHYIDAHSHLWTPDTTKYPLAPGFKKSDMKPASFTPEELFKHCKPEGVDRIVAIQMSYYRFDNRYMLDMIARHPGVFRGVAIVDESLADVAQQMKTLAKQGVSGFRVNRGQQSLVSWIDSPGMERMWKTAAEEGLAICPLIDPEALPLLDRMCARFPKTRVVIDHFARLGMAGPAPKSQLDALCRLARHPHTHVKTSAFYALGQKKAPYLDMGPMIRRLRDAYGAQRLMWASDCPFQVGEGHTYHDSIALIRDNLDFLTQEDKNWMLRKTAEKVFFV
ncbi:MAG: Amidohydrolase [Verrucomicrobiaceae bacterium]|nr:Amidohydrolase [Verrucomicrobiaceae bacterium]